MLGWGRMNTRKIVTLIVAAIAVVVIGAAIVHRSRGTALSRCGFKSNVATFQTINDSAAFESSHGTNGLGDSVRVAIADVGVTSTDRGDKAIDLRIEPRDVPALSDWSKRALNKSARISVDDLEVSVAQVRDELRGNVAIPLAPPENRPPGQQAIAKAVGWK